MPSTVPGLDTMILDGADAIARMPAQGSPADTAVEIVMLGTSGPRYAAVLAGPAGKQVLGTGDLLEPILRHASDFARAHGTPGAAAPRDALSIGLGQYTAAEMEAARGWELTAHQAKALETYAAGDFAWLADIARKDGAVAFDRAIAGAGDEFLRYILRELDTREGCDESASDDETPDARMSDMIDDLEAIRAAFDSIPASGTRP